MKITLKYFHLSFTLDQRSGESRREIVRQSEDGAIHKTETGGGEIFICAKSPGRLPLKIGFRL